MPDAAWAVDEWTQHELDDSRSDLLPEPIQLPFHRCRDDKLPLGHRHRLRYLSRSWSAVRILPCLASRRACSISATAVGLDSKSSVSSNDARSSGLSRTAAGRPLRMTVMRSCWFST